MSIAPRGATLALPRVPLVPGPSPPCFVLGSLCRATLQISTDKLFPGLFLESWLGQAGDRDFPGGFSPRAVGLGAAREPSGSAGGPVGTSSARHFHDISGSFHIFGSPLCSPALS